MKPGPKTGRTAYSARDEDYATTYQQEYIRCGKANCSTCSTSQGHGPYWYSYHYNPARRRRIKTYIGKNLPAQAET